MDNSAHSQPGCDKGTVYINPHGVQVLTHPSTSVLNPDHWSCVSTVPESFRLSNVLEVYHYTPSV